MKKLLMFIPLVFICGISQADIFSMGEPTLVVMSGTTITGTAVTGNGNSIVGWTKLTSSDQFYRIASVYEETGVYNVLVTSNPSPYSVVSDYAVGFPQNEKMFRFTPPTTNGLYTGLYVSLTFTTIYSGGTKPRIKFEAYK
jgi:hypothetical protein